MQSGSQPIRGGAILTTLHTRFGMLPVQDALHLTFEQGLPGFEGRREFALLSIPQSESLYCLQDSHDETVSFVVRTAHLQGASEPSPVGSTERGLLQLTDDADLMLLLLATRHATRGLSFETTHPLAINLRTRKGVQCGLHATASPLDDAQGGKSLAASQPTAVDAASSQPVLPPRRRSASSARRLQK